jgi:hypothetical protein
MRAWVKRGMLPSMAPSYGNPLALFDRPRPRLFILCACLSGSKQKENRSRVHRQARKDTIRLGGLPSGVKAQETGGLCAFVTLQPSEVPALQSEVAPTDLASVEPRTGN